MSASQAQKGFPYKCIVVIGATSGIGWHFAAKLYNEGKKVIIVGRRKARLDEFAQQYAGEKGDAKRIASYVFDITDLKGIPEFVKKLTTEHPEIDAIWHNSGIQRGFNFAEPTTIDLSLIDLELATNYTSVIHFTKYALSFLISRQKSTPTALLFTTSTLALIPLARCPNYCATKAALHHFLLSLRGHMESEDTGVRIMEILPPQVQTELHDKEMQPDIENGRQQGMGVTEFVNELWEDLNGGQGAIGEDRDEFPVGGGKKIYDVIETARRSQMAGVPMVPAKIPQ